MNNKLISFRQTGQGAMTKDADGSVTISISIAIKRRSGRTIVRSPGGVTANPNKVTRDITSLQLALARGHRDVLLAGRDDAEVRGRLDE